MYEINPVEQPFGTFIYKSKNEFNQIITLKIQIWDDSIKVIRWNVYFRIGKNKNKYKDLEQMMVRGKDGLKSLLWAKNCIKDFINKISNDEFFIKRHNHIEVYWTNSKRRNVYERGLKDLGFIKEKGFLVFKIPNITQ